MTCIDCGCAIADPGPAICDNCYDSDRPDPETRASDAERRWEDARDREIDRALAGKGAA